MSISDMKITPEQIQKKGVIASPDTLTGTADENKSVFDRLASEIIVPVVNAAIDEMSSMQEDADQWAADEEVRKANEIIRQENEAQRIANEQARQEAESKRQNTFQQEVMQAAASAVRAEEEADRAKREADRAAAIAGGDFVTNAEKDVPGGVAGLDADGKVSLAAIPANGGSLLTLTFDPSFAGLRYTIAGGTETYQGVVPEGLTVRQNLLAAATKYDITVNLAFSEKRTSVMTQDYYTALQVTVAPFAATITVTCPAGSTVTCAKGDKMLSQTATEGTAVFTVDEAGTWTITATLDGQTASGTVEITEEGQSKSIALVYAHIYGVIWDGTNTSVLSRTNDAQDFVDPVPYVAGASEYGSPFDELTPWTEMHRVSDQKAGELVEIPKFWYKWSKYGNVISLQIADGPVEGYSVSYAHCDRGDGQGERDFAYVGRYACAEDYRSKTGFLPLVSVERSTAREKMHALGDDIWQWDWAMIWTIRTLYLVEFADWDSQNVIGKGGGDRSSRKNTGKSDSMPYHTGTPYNSRETWGSGVQYRYIEDLWGNVMNWVDGAYHDVNGLNVILNPTLFSETENGVTIGLPGYTGTGFPIAFAVSEKLDAQWIYPIEKGGYSADYTTDAWAFYPTNPNIVCGGQYNQDNGYGLFNNGANQLGSTQDFIGCRLMKLPNKEAA